MLQRSSTWNHEKEKGRIEAILNRRRPPPCIIHSPLIPLNELGVGCICWLLAKSQVPDIIPCVRDGHYCAGEPLRDEGHWHPVVIVGLYQRPGSQVPGDVLARFQLVSSYNKVELDNYAEFKPKLRKFFDVLPIRQRPEDPARGIYRRALPGHTIEDPRHIPLGITHLELSPQSQLLPMQSYVDIGHVWQVPIKYLKPFEFRGLYAHPYCYRVSKNTYHALAQKSGIEPQEYLLTTVLASRTWHEAVTSYGIDPLIPTQTSQLQGQFALRGDITPSREWAAYGNNRQKKGGNTGQSSRLFNWRDNRQSRQQINGRGRAETMPSYSSTSEAMGELSMKLDSSSSISQSTNKLDPTASPFVPRSRAPSDAQTMAMVKYAPAVKPTPVENMLGIMKEPIIPHTMFLLSLGIGAGRYEIDSLIDIEDSAEAPRPEPFYEH